MHVLRAAQEGDAHAGPDRLWLDGEFGAFLLQLGDDGIDPLDPQPEMFEPEIGRLRRRGDSLFVRNLRDEDRYAAEIEVEARPAVGLHRTDDLGAEHPLVPAGGLLGVGAAQMDVVIGEGGHRVSPLFAARYNSRPRTDLVPARSLAAYLGTAPL